METVASKALAAALSLPLALALPTLGCAQAIDPLLAPATKAGATPAASPDSAPRDLYGLTNLGIKWLSAQKFLPMAGNAPLRYENSNFWNNPGSASPQRYIAVIDEVPNGALIAGLSCVFNDQSPVNDLFFQVYRSTQNFPAGATGGNRTVEILSSGPSQAGMPGVAYLPIFLPPGVTFQTTPTLTQVTQYGVTVDVASDTSVAGCGVFYTLQVSPAPATASFTDVPPSHPFFQVIEALKASGITAGCTSTEFCPDAPVTRAAMAAFLARALGLFFPF